VSRLQPAWLQRFSAFKTQKTQKTPKKQATREAANRDGAGMKPVLKSDDDQAMCFDEAVCHFKARMSTHGVIPHEPVESCSEIRGGTWCLNNAAGPLARVDTDTGAVS